MRVAQTIASIAAAVFVLVVPSSIAAQTSPIARDSQVTARVQAVSSKQQQQLRSLSRDIAHYQVLTWRCQGTLGTGRTRASASPWALPQSIAYRTWVKSRWSSQKASCEHNLALRTIPVTHDWLTAVKLVQRIFPGTEEWLLFISHREGGWGGFVMNSQGSGCGGWLQYAASTYWAYSYDAFTEARRKGYIVPDANQWTNPLGQALTGAYMRYTGRDGRHWAL